MEDMINYSIIIPHKNIPDLLQRCLDSIPRRDDIQIIIVDDNSNPQKVDFENFPGLGDPCVEVYFTKEGKGAGYARNVGLKYAKGKWLFFADSDDTYTSSFSKFLTDSKDLVADVVYFKANLINNDVSKSPFFLMNYYITQYLYHGGALSDVKFGAWEPWNKMISRQLVVQNNILFDEIPSSNDKMFSLKVGEFAERVIVIEQYLYNYILRKNSIIHNRNSNRLFYSLSTSINQNILYKRVGYKRCVFIPFLILSNITLLTSRTFYLYLNYLCDFRINPFEGFFDFFIYQMWIRYKNK